MTEPIVDTPLSRTDASEAVQDIGCGTSSARCARRAGAGHSRRPAKWQPRGRGKREDGEGHLRLDLRLDRVELSVQTRALSTVTRRDTQLARCIGRYLGRLGLRWRGDVRPVTTAGADAGNGHRRA